MPDRRKNLKWHLHDFFAGCEMSSKLFAVIVGDFGHDHEAVFEKIL